MIGSPGGKSKLGMAALRSAAAAWGRTEGASWLFVTKVSLAALSAMLIAMRLELDQPRTAMITVFVVMQPQTGLVLARSLYRIAGTVAGILVSLLLVGAFAQEPELFILGLALWVGICTAGAAFYRNFRSYAFVLAGYTAALVGLPAVLQPAAFFSLATTRLSEIAIGILCAGIFSDTLFPRPLSDAIISNVRSRYTDFIALVQATLSGSAGRRELHEMQLRLVGDVIRLESLRGAASMEDPEVRARDFRLRKLNSEFMAASATFHSFHQLMVRLQRNSTAAGVALASLYENLGETLAQMDDAPRNAEAAQLAARRIAVFRVQLSRQVDRVRVLILAVDDPQERMDFETAVELLYRFIRDLHAYTRTYAALPAAHRGPRSPDDIRFASRTDPLVALASGGRAFVGILIVGAFWIASAWPYGVSALTFVTIVSALCSSAPDPPDTVRQMTIGFSCAFVPALMYKFLVVPTLDGAVLLTATMAPVLLFGSWLTARSRLSGIGAGFLIFFTSMAAPSNSMHFDPVDVVNDGSATIIGVAVAGILFGTLIPVTGSWFKRRLARQLRNQVVMACFDPLEGLAHRFESGTHDLLHTLIAHGGRQAEARSLLVWLFPVLEIGRAVIRLRNDAGSIRLSRTLSARITKTMRSTARLFRSPSAARRDAALASVSSAIEAASREAAGEERRIGQEVLHRMLTSLHLMRSVLLEEDTVTAAAVPIPTTTFFGGLDHAA
jgi:uncharacterized membrane protein YccC